MSGEFSITVPQIYSHLCVCNQIVDQSNASLCRHLFITISGKYSQNFLFVKSGYSSITNMRHCYVFQSIKKIQNPFYCIIYMLFFFQRETSSRLSFSSTDPTSAIENLSFDCWSSEAYHSIRVPLSRNLYSKSNTSPSVS